MTSSNGTSAILVFRGGNSQVTDAFPSQRPVTRSFDVSLIWAWINGRVNNRGPVDLRRNCAHYDVTIMYITVGYKRQLDILYMSMAQSKTDVTLLLTHKSCLLFMKLSIYEYYSIESNRTRMPLEKCVIREICQGICCTSWQCTDTAIRNRMCSVQRYAFTLNMSLHWRHNDHDGVSNHQPHGCLLNRLFSRRSKKISKLRVTGLCVGNSPEPVNSPHKGPVTRKMLPFDDVTMLYGLCAIVSTCSVTNWWVWFITHTSQANMQWVIWRK